jgi:hypothetical protein
MKNAIKRLWFRMKVFFGFAISEESAIKTGEMMAGITDTVLTTLIQLYAKESNTEKYEIPKKAMSDIKSCWIEIAKKHKIETEKLPELEMILRTVIGYLPLLQEARFDHMIYLQKEEIEKLKNRELFPNN